jgi:hypothetical protein
MIDDIRKIIMKIPLSLLLFFISISFANIHPVDTSKLEFKAYIINHSSNTLLIKTEIINKGDDTLRYLSMSCGWDEVYRLNTKNWNTAPVPCDKNVPTAVKIPPHKSEVRTLKLTRNKHILNKDTVLRVGFSFVSLNKDQNPLADGYLLLQNNTNIIWSKKLLLP